MSVLNKIDYGGGAVCFKLECEDLTCENGAEAFAEIKHFVISSGDAIKECVVDVNKIKTADPLALSLLSATKNLCIKFKKSFYVAGLSEDMNQEMIRHSSFKGKHLPAKNANQHSMQDQIIHLGDLSIDFGKNFKEIKIKIIVKNISKIRK